MDPRIMDAQADYGSGWLREPKRRPKVNPEKGGAFTKGNVNRMDLARRTLCAADQPRDWNSKYDYGRKSARKQAKPLQAKPARKTPGWIADLSRDELLTLWGKAVVHVGGQAKWNALSTDARERVLDRVA